MIINENLLKDSTFKNNPGYWRNQNNYRKEESVITAIYNKPYDLGVILESSEDLKPNTDYTLSIYVRGTKEFNINYVYFMYGQDGNLPLMYNGDSLKPNIWHKVSIPFRHNKNHCFRNVMVGYNYRQDGDMELSFKYPKLEIGEVATPYILNKIDLDPSKQAIFVAGGVFKEVYPL